ncbi:hypothetical protein [Brucella anthropi]|uniref:Uncharacterized protein n=1 Tax=Brucella anthropi TaxID=529 RepID=A0A8I0NAK9_BRUAN|nr:hypothetical protein [Brucella anthropi]KAB2751755.1 hypothetical protein F9L05_01060 [Brucella anthropi]MBE0563620.1 hypothetical protein [Brucella anthropi]
MSKSFPFLAIAKRHDIPYTLVLCCAEYLKNPIDLSQCRHWVRKAVEHMHHRPLHNESLFINDMMNAVHSTR